MSLCLAKTWEYLGVFGSPIQTAITSGGKPWFQDLSMENSMHAQLDMMIYVNL